jgi:hypothetical protein
LRFVVSIARLESPVAVVVEIDVFRLAPAAVPLEDQPPLLADADRMKTRQLEAAGLRPRLLSAPFSDAYGRVALRPLRRSPAGPRSGQLGIDFQESSK